MSLIEHVFCTVLTEDDTYCTTNWTTLGHHDLRHIGITESDCGGPSNWATNCHDFWRWVGLAATRGLRKARGSSGSVDDCLSQGLHLTKYIVGIMVAKNEAACTSDRAPHSCWSIRNPWRRADIGFTSS
jgi:hypothetical protein